MWSDTTTKNTVFECSFSVVTKFKSSCIKIFATSEKYMGNKI